MFFAKKRSQQQLQPQHSQHWQSGEDGNGGENVQLPVEVEACMDEIIRDWDFMTADEFNPVTLALELLDSNKATRSITQFNQAKDRLEHAMDLIVNDHYQAFNSSIETFARVTAGIADSQRRVKQLRADMDRCKELLLCRRPDLMQLWSKSVQYREMIRMLEVIETLKQAPETVERLVRSKHYLTAVKTLQSSLKTIVSAEYAEIGALNDIRTSLNIMKSSIHETIIEELHRLIYLKPPFTNVASQMLASTTSHGGSGQRLATHARTASSSGGGAGGGSDERAHSHSRHNSSTASGRSLGAAAANRANAASSGWKLSTDTLAGSGGGGGKQQPPQQASSAGRTRANSDLNNNNNNNQFQSGEVVEDLLTDPQSNPLRFIEVMLTALDELGRLQDAAQVIKQRIPLELFKISESVIRDTESNWAIALFSEGGIINGVDTSGRGAGIALAVAGISTESRVISKLWKLKSSLGARFLEDLLSELYDKLFAVMQMHNFVIHAFLRINSNSESQSTEKRFIRYNLLDLWSAIQAEAKNLLGAYLVDKQHVIAPVDINLELAIKKQTAAMERRILFRFADSSLAQQMPSNGRLIKDDQQQGGQQTGAVVGVVDSLTVNTDADGHSLVIKPSVFNIIRTFRPTMDFSHDVEHYFFNRVDKQSSVQTFLTDLLTKSFLPQVEDIIIQKFHGFVNGIDSFRVETIDDAPVPILKSSLQLIGLCKDLCLVGHAIPVHQEDFVGIMETMLGKYYEKCLVRYESLLIVESATYFQSASLSPGSEEQLQRILSAQWLDNEEIVKLLCKNTYLPAESATINAPSVDRSLNDMLAKKETLIEIQMQKERSLFRSEMIFDQAKLQMIASLRSSLVWFVQKMQEIIKSGVFSRVTIDKRPISEILSQSRRLVGLDKILNSRSVDSSDPEYSDEVLRETVCLKLDEPTKERFTEIIKKFDSLAESCLFLLHIEARCHCLYFLDLAIREGNYCPEQPSLEPDLHITALNNDLNTMELLTARYLIPKEAKFVLDGIPVLASHLLLASSKHIRRMNEFGVDKMSRNILALQQNLNNISLTYENRLDHARKFYELYRLGAKEMLKSIEQHGPSYSFEDYRLMLQFIYQDILDIANNPKKKLFDDDLTALKRICIK